MLLNKARGVSYGETKTILFIPLFNFDFFFILFTLFSLFSLFSFRLRHRATSEINGECGHG